MSHFKKFILPEKYGVMGNVKRLEVYVLIGLEIMSKKNK